MGRLGSPHFNYIKYYIIIGHIDIKIDRILKIRFQAES